MVTDHFAIHYVLDFQKPHRVRKTIQFWRIKAINRQDFKQDLIHSSLILKPAESLDALAAQYNSVLSQLLEKHTPLLTPPCLSDEGFLGATWKLLLPRGSGLSLRDSGATLGLHVTDVYSRNKEMQWRVCWGKWVLVTSTRRSRTRRGDQKKMFRVINSLKQEYCTDSTSSWISRGSRYFVFWLLCRQDHQAQEGTTRNASSWGPYSPPQSGGCNSALATFSLASVDEVHKVIMKSPSKSCPLDLDLDPMPTT